MTLMGAFRSVVLCGERVGFCPLGDIWQHLEAFLVVTAGGGLLLASSG